MPNDTPDSAPRQQGSVNINCDSSSPNGLAPVGRNPRVILRDTVPGGTTAPPTVVELADRLARGWAWFKETDDVMHPTGAALADERRADFEARGEISEEIAAATPANLREALIRAAAFSDVLTGFAADAERVIRSASHAFSDVLAHAHAEGVSMHPVCLTYFCKKAPEPASSSPAVGEVAL